MAGTLTQNADGIWTDQSGSSEGFSTLPGNYNPETGQLEAGATSGTLTPANQSGGNDSVGSFAPTPVNSGGSNYSPFTLAMTGLMSNLQQQAGAGSANLSAQQGQLMNESVTSTPGFNPSLGSANAGIMSSATNAFQPTIAGMGNYMNTYSQNAQNALAVANAALQQYGAAANQQVAPGNTLVNGSGQPLYGLGAGSGVDAYTNYSNLQFNTAQGQAAGKIASDIKVSSNLIDSSFQTLSNIESKYGINASDYPDVADLNRALMSKVGGGAGAVAAFADASNSLSSAISALINNTSVFTPQEIGDMTKELNAASLNPSALQELYDTVKQTAANKYNAQIAQALYYDKLGTQSGPQNMSPINSSPTNLNTNSAPGGFAWNPTSTNTSTSISTTTPTTTNGQLSSLGVLAPQTTTALQPKTWLQTLEGIPNVLGLNI